MTSTESPPLPVPRAMRWSSTLLALLLTVLFVWLLGFVLADIGEVEGPDLAAIVAEHVDPALRAHAERLAQQIDDLRTSVERQTQIQEDLGRSMDNARSTMQQIMDLQRLSLEQGAPPSDVEREALATAQQRFLGAQAEFESANARITAANETRFALEQELRGARAALEEQEQPALLEYGRRWHEHRLAVATTKLAVIVPLVALAAWLFARHRRSPYRPILAAALAATSWTLGRVMFEHFPREYFKYIAIVAAIGIVLAFLVWLLRRAARPGRDLRLRRYREAYRSHVCPVCAFPVARGPLRFALWTRRGPRAGAEVAHEPAAAGSPYACPSCGTPLFVACAECGGLRHALLPFCEHCGREHAAPAAG